MGVWGSGNFDNDTACDWAYELEGCNDLSVIYRTIEAVFEEDYIDADVGSEALAAIDTIARLKGNPGIKNSHTENVDKWIEKNSVEPPKDLIEKANKAIDLIESENSELFELWSEGDGSLLEEWKKELVLLRDRINT